MSRVTCSYPAFVELGCHPRGGQTWPRSSFRGPVCSVDQVSRGQFKSDWISWLWAHFKSYQVKLGDDPKAVLAWRDVPRWEPSGRVWSVLPLGEWHTFTPSLCYIHPFSQPNCHHQQLLWVTIINYKPFQSFKATASLRNDKERAELFWCLFLWNKRQWWEIESMFRSNIAR